LFDDHSKHGGTIDLRNGEHRAAIAELSLPVQVASAVQ
jgi:hypothetical protein